MSRPGVTGLHHVKWLVTEAATTRAWYERVLGFETVIEFPGEDGALAGVVGRLPGVSPMLAFRADADRAAVLAGTDPLALAVADREALDDWAAYLDDLGVTHSPILPAQRGLAMGMTDPDGLQIVLYADEVH